MGEPGKRNWLKGGKSKNCWIPALCIFVNNQKPPFSKNQSIIKDEPSSS
jgi:hypothetical protein